MTGREEKIHNDIFFVCSLIEYIGRKTNNHRTYIAKTLGESGIKKLLDLADVYHSDNIDDVSDSFIQNYNITQGNFDNISTCLYTVPTHWDIGKVYKRLAIMIAKNNKIDFVKSITEAFSSFISEKIEDFNSSFYYDNPDYIYSCYKTGEVLD